MTVVAQAFHARDPSHDMFKFVTKEENYFFAMSQAPK